MTDFELRAKAGNRCDQRNHCGLKVPLTCCQHWNLRYFVILCNLGNEWSGDPETDEDVILIRAVIAKAKGE